MTNSPVFSAIRLRRSVRGFKPDSIPAGHITLILEAGQWAPSGLNNQPWRFVIIQTEDIISRLALLDKHSSFIKKAPLLIAVYLDLDVSYDRTKDIQSIGACLQNMLLAAYELGLGACWVGRLLSQAKIVSEILGIAGSYELMAVIAVGYPLREQANRKSARRSLSELILKKL